MILHIYYDCGCVGWKNLSDDEVEKYRKKEASQKRLPGYRMRQNKISVHEVPGIIETGVEGYCPKCIPDKKHK